MTKDEKVAYWLTSAKHDWIVTGHLCKKKDYSHALFLAHLTLEKILKGLFVHRHDQVPPFTHRLTYLAEKKRSILPRSNLSFLKPDTRTKSFLSTKNAPLNLPNTT